MKFSEQNGESDDKLKSAVEQQDNAGQLVPLQIKNLCITFIYFKVRKTVNSTLE